MGVAYGSPTPRSVARSRSSQYSTATCADGPRSRAQRWRRARRNDFWPYGHASRAATTNNSSGSSVRRMSRTCWYSAR
jgi:hypothetical protein